MGWKIFKVSLHSSQKGANLLILWRPPPPILPTSPSLFQILSTLPLPPLSCHLQPPSPLLFLLSCFFGWVGDHTTFKVLFYLMIKWIYIYVKPWYLVQEGPWCVFYATRRQSYWGFLLLLWFDITHADTHNTFRGQ